MTDWKIVPVEPTPEMVAAAFPGEFGVPPEHAKAAYTAMLAAAPPVPEDVVERVAMVLYVAKLGPPGVLRGTPAERDELCAEWRFISKDVPVRTRWMDEARALLRLSGLVRP